MTAAFTSRLATIAEWLRPTAWKHEVLRRALGRAGLVEGYRHACQCKGCGYEEQQAHSVPGA